MTPEEISQSIDELMALHREFTDNVIIPKINETHKSPSMAALTLAMLDVAYMRSFMLANWPEDHEKPPLVMASLIALKPFEDVAHKLAAREAGVDLTAFPPGTPIRVALNDELA